MMATCLRVDDGSAVWQLTLDRPAQGNACSAELIAALDDTLQRAEREQAQALVLQGAGRHFCTGFDLSDIGNESDDSLLARCVRIELVLQRLARAPFLTVAVAHGRAIGAGADLFAACELRLARGAASFAFPGARGFGLVLGTRRLCEAVGRTQALKWIEGGVTITEEEALHAGLVHGRIGQEDSVASLVAARLHDDGVLRKSLRLAANPHREIEDALDLRRLVESAARVGLRDRIAAYIERGAARRSS
jgi:enoyl-CoA hydratase/carnithine racemase